MVPHPSIKWNDERMANVQSGYHSLFCLFNWEQTACCYLQPHSYYVCMQLLFKPGCPVSPLTMYPAIYHWGRRLFSHLIHFSAPGFSAWHSSKRVIPHLDDHLPLVNKLKCQPGMNQNRDSKYLLHHHRAWVCYTSCTHCATWSWCCHSRWKVKRCLIRMLI